MFFAKKKIRKMNRKSIMRCLMAALLCVAVAGMVLSCKKSRYCYCTSSETKKPDTVIWNLDAGMKCDRLQHMGYQHNVQVLDSATGVYHTETSDALYTYKCYELEADTLKSFDNLHVE